MAAPTAMPQASPSSFMFSACSTRHARADGLLDQRLQDTGICVPGDIDLLRPPVPQGAAGLFAPHDLLGLFEFFQHLGALLLAVTSAQALLRLSSPPRSIGSGSGFFQVFIG